MLHRLFELFGLGHQFVDVLLVSLQVDVWYSDSGLVLDGHSAFHLWLGAERRWGQITRILPRRFVAPASNPRPVLGNVCFDGPGAFGDSGVFHNGDTMFLLSCLYYRLIGLRRSNRLDGKVFAEELAVNLRQARVEIRKRLSLAVCVRARVASIGVPGPH